MNTVPQFDEEPMSAEEFYQRRQEAYYEDQRVVDAINHVDNVKYHYRDWLIENGYMTDKDVITAAGYDTGLFSLDTEDGRALGAEMRRRVP